MNEGNASVRVGGEFNLVGLLYGIAVELPAALPYALDGDVLDLLLFVGYYKA